MMLHGQILIRPYVHSFQYTGLEKGTLKKEKEKTKHPPKKFKFAPNTIKGSL